MCMFMALAIAGVCRVLKESDAWTVVQRQQASAKGADLFQIKQSMLAFASLQGFSNSNETGRLPCADRNSDGVADAPCYQQDRLAGKLPVLSRITPNSWIAGLPVKPTVRAEQLFYAVAPRATNGLAIDWSEPIDAGQLLHVTNSNGQSLCENCAAVVAEKGYQQAQSNVMVIDGLYQCISFHELAAVVHLKARALVAQQLQRATQSGQGVASSIHHVVAAGNRLDFLNSGCACNCTKTQCSCNCSAPSQWVSNAACTNSSTGTCITSQGQTRCTASTNQTCVFKGAASLGSFWPISKFTPQPLPGSACSSAVAIQTSCPLSLTSTACNCQFDWPVTLQNGLVQKLHGWADAWNNHYIGSDVVAGTLQNPEAILRRTRGPQHEVSQLLTRWNVQP